MENQWITVSHFEEQENRVKVQTEEYFGKDRSGFCDFALDGIELMLHGTGYLRDIDELDKGNEHKDFNTAIRELAYFHYHRAIFSFKAAYNLTIRGYYTESAILLRSIVETFVRLKYIAKSGKKDYIYSALKGTLRKDFDINYKKQFGKVAPGFYFFYQLLCGIAHGDMGSHILKTKMDCEGQVTFDTGVVFKPHDSTFIINQFCVYLLAHLEFMMWVFPEIKKKMPEPYACKYHKTLSRLWGYMSEISKIEQKKTWFNASKKLVDI